MTKIFSHMLINQLPDQCHITASTPSNIMCLPNIIYHIVQGKCPWALTAQAPKIEGERLHGGGA